MSFHHFRSRHLEAFGGILLQISNSFGRVARYPYPTQPSVRLWDLPGAGTVAVPAETYLQDMGLRYFDRVVVVSAQRFTETEVALRGELERHGVPYCLVRSKATGRRGAPGPSLAGRWIKTSPTTRRRGEAWERRALGARTTTRRGTRR